MISDNHGHMPILLQSSQPLNPSYPNISVIFKVTGLNDIRYMVGALVGKQKNVETVCFANNGVINNALCKLWSNVQYLGVTSVNNSAVKYYVAEASGFDNTTQELRIFNYFKSVGCDVIISQLNSFYMHMLAKTEDIYSVAWSSDMRQFIGETVLTSVRKNWEVPMGEFIDDLFAGNYSAHVYEDSFANRGIDLAPLSTRVTPAAASHLKKVEKKLSQGKINVFCGDAVKAQFGTDCTTEANLSSVYLPGIVVVNAKNL
jgi:basic membrane lipoprotein Med (substrate-binding protein (PBP1-ABC) superfamily)